MGTSRYYDLKRKLVPSVTTVLGGFKDADGLIRWAHKVGLEGRELYEEKDTAANAGTLAHCMVENDMNGRPWDHNLPTEEKFGIDPISYAEVLEAGRTGYDNYLRWKKAVEMQVISTELALVHDKLRFGGTPDFVAIAWDKLVLCDLKTSGRIYDDYLVQCAAYIVLWREGRLNKPGIVPPRFNEPIDEVVILRVSRATFEDSESGEEKDVGAFNFLSFRGDVLVEAERQFMDFRKCYERRKTLKKAVGA